MNDYILNNLQEYTLLFVENEKGIRENYRDFFGLLFKEVSVASDGIEALSLFSKNKYDLIITDIKMPNMDGIELVKRIREVDTNISIVIVSAHTDVELLLSSIPLNLIKYIVKPLNEQKLLGVFDDFIKNKMIKKIINFKFNKEKSQVSFLNETHELSLKESLFIEKLLNTKNIISYEEIESDIWNGNSMSQNALRLFMRNLRKKLPENVIKNIPNQGYILK